MMYDYIEWFIFVISFDVFGKESSNIFGEEMVF